MKSLEHFLWFGLLGLLLSGTALAQTSESRWYQSPLGLMLLLPEHWQAVSPDVLEESQNTLVVPSNGGAQSMDWLVNTQPVDDGVYDNLSLRLSRDPVPDSRARVRSTCQALPDLLQRSLGEAVSLSRCEALQLGGQPGLLIDYTSSALGNRVRQYLISHRQGGSLYLTLSYHDPDEVGSVEAVEQMLADLRWDTSM